MDTGIDLASYIDERTRDFTGRDWVLSEIDGWLDKTGPRIFFLGGGPGSGKTTIAARLAQISAGDVPAGPAKRLIPGFLTYAHFCRAQHDSTLRPVRFVSALSEALGNRYEQFRLELLRAFETRGDQAIQATINQQVTQAAGGARVIGLQVNIGERENARTAFDLLVREPLENMSYALSEDERIVVLIDSLDEALTFDEQNNLLDLLRRLQDFPKQVRFILTSRPDERVVNILGKPTLDLVADAKGDDIYDYTLARLGQLGEKERSAFAERLAKTAAGNFLYARYVLDDLLPRLNEIDDLEAFPLPKDLADHYLMYVEREMAFPLDAWQKLYGPVLGTIALSRGEGLAAGQLANITMLPESQIDQALAKSYQYLTGLQPDGPYLVFHHSFREFLLRNKTYRIFPKEVEGNIAGYAIRSCRKGWRGCDDDYALAFAPTHLAEAARLNRNGAGYDYTRQLVTLTANSDYQDGYEERYRDIVAVQGFLELALQTAACDEEDGALELAIQAARALLEYRQRKLDPTALLDLAVAGQVEEAEARLDLFALELRWRRAALMLIAWLALPDNVSPAADIRDRLADQVREDEVLDLLWRRLDRAVAGGDLTPAELPDLGQAPQEWQVEGIVRRMGGGDYDESYRFLDEAISEQMYSESRYILREGLLEVPGRKGPVYVGDMEGPALVAFAVDYPDEGQRFLGRYVQAHALNSYTYYRNLSLWGVLRAVIRHPMAKWVKMAMRTVLEAAMAGTRLHFQESLPISLASLAGRPSPSEAMTSLAQETEEKLDKQIRKSGRGDLWGEHSRRHSALAEAFAISLNDGVPAETLLNEAARIPEGFAGFRVPTCLALAESMRVCGLDEGVIEKALDAAEKAAQNIQDPVFCVRMAARVQALRTQFWAIPDGGFDVGAAVERLLAAPDGPAGAAYHRIGEKYSLRDVKVPDCLPLPEIAYQARRLWELADLYQRPLVTLQRLNPELDDPHKPLDDDTLVKIPDPGFVPLLASRLAAEALVADGLNDFGRKAVIQSLVPLTTSEPTILDTVLARLLLAARPDEPAILNSLEKAVSG